MIFPNKIILFFFLLTISLSLNAQSRPYNIEGNIANVANSKAYMTYEDSEGVYKIDSCDVTNGKFSFKGSAKYPFFARITLDHDGKSFGEPHADVLKLYVDPETIKISGDKNIESATVTGSSTTDLFIEYNNKQKAYKREYELLEHTFRNASLAQRITKTYTDSINRCYMDIQQRYQQMSLNFIESHPQSIIGIYMLLSEVQTHPGNEAIERVFNQLSLETRDTFHGKKLAKLIEKYKTLTVGKIAPDFQIEDIDFSTVKLSDFQGKYVFLLFWSPDCDHCKDEIRQLKEIYKKYKNKGLEIFGIAITSDKPDWLRISYEEGIIWTNASEMKGWEGNITKLYKIFAVPYNYLIDPNGKIIGKELYGEKLINTLNNLFNK